jgi:hypothetical protein
MEQQIRAPAERGMYDHGIVDRVFRENISRGYFL